MKNLFAYFKVKNENKSQPSPLKRNKEQVLDMNEPKTCPLKKPPEQFQVDSNSDHLRLNSGDICVMSLENNDICFPVLVNDARRNGSNENFSFKSKPSVSRYGSDKCIWLKKSHSLKVITSKNELLNYMKNCKDTKTTSEYEEFLHMFDFTHKERLDIFYSVSIQHEWSEDEIIPKVKSTKKVSFLDGSENENNDIKESETSMIQLSKYSFNMETDEDDSNEAEQSLLDLENTVKQIKYKNKGSQGKTLNLVENSYQHHHLEFLKDKFRKDKNGIPHYHPESDRTTLYVPNNFINSKEVTPVLKQWWKMKSEHFDTVLLFKLGKFYESYHMDADIVVKELGLIYMKGNLAHAGFPESSIPQYASTLVQKGYKVARVEQTETPQMMNERIKTKTSSKGGTTDKVVNREICSIVSPGTRIFDPFDMEIDANVNMNNSEGVVGFGMLAIIVDGSNVSHLSKQNELGVCILDCSTGKFFFGQFSDDSTLSQLRTMLSSMPLPVAEVIIPKKVVSSNLRSFIARSLSHARKELTNDQIDSTQAILQLTTYFTSSDSAKNDPSCELFNALDINSVEIHNYTLAFTAIGYCINYLKKNRIDRRVFSMKNFTKYVPKSNLNSSSTCTFNANQRRYMVLDHNAITNLDILCNEDEIFNKNGSLIGLLDHCSTSFGRRLLPGLISQPLYRKKDIEERLTAVEAIMSWDERESIRKQMRTLPDLHRLFFRIHANGDLLTNEDHPDNRAVIFNANLFNKKKVADLLNALAGFNKLCDIAEQLQPLTEKSGLIDELLDGQQKTKCYHSTRNTVEFFQNAFNVTEAKENGVIIPKVGVLVEYDQTIEDIKELLNWFDGRLEELKIQTSIKTLKYWSSGKIRYYIEVTESTKNLPSTFIYKSQRKGFCRYALKELEEQTAYLTQLEDKRDKLLSKSLGLLLKQLSTNKDHLQLVIHNMSMIDCLFSFAVFSNGVYHGSMCRPVILRNDNSSPLIHIEQGYHPYLASLTSEFVCNDFILGNNESEDNNNAAGERTMIITGPNMGGKSTLMRQVAIIVILAQLGCYVPAMSCQLTPVDRIFARLGASFDKPCSGQSTFYVELLETSTLLNHATKNSLVILDELGRGTATYDGMAIAGAVLEYISTKIQCLLLFSTHYHSLVKDLVNSPIGTNFQYYQMSFLIDELSNVSKSSDTRNTAIIFLYRLVRGICSNSYGFHVARLAGLPPNIIESGIHQANELEKRFLARRLLEMTNSTNEKKVQIITDLFKSLVSL